MNILKLIFAYFLALLIAGSFCLPLIASISNNIKDKKDQKEFKKKMQDAVKKITADGKVEGPKAPYVPHKQQTSLTDHSTSAPKNSGYYNHPWH